MGIKLESLKNLLTKPFTELYPFQRKIPAPRFRGNIRYYPKRCIGCRLCEKNCPVNAIKFYSKGKIKFDMKVCILCGNCADVCPVSAIEYTQDYERATNNKKKITFEESQDGSLPK